MRRAVWGALLAALLGCASTPDPLYLAIPGAPVPSSRVLVVRHLSPGGLWAVAIHLVPGLSAPENMSSAFSVSCDHPLVEACLRSLAAELDVPAYADPAQRAGPSQTLFFQGLRRFLEGEKDRGSAEFRELRARSKHTSVPPWYLLVALQLLAAQLHAERRFPESLICKEESLAIAFENDYLRFCVESDLARAEWHFGSTSRALPKLEQALRKNRAYRRTTAYEETELVLEQAGRNE